jgi:hypothetical protein
MIKHQQPLNQDRLHKTTVLTKPREDSGNSETDSARMLLKGKFERVGAILRDFPREHLGKPVSAQQVCSSTAS